MKDFLEKNSKIVLIIIFILGIIIYGFVASKMTSPAYLNVDEELYISMARTFFFDGNIAKNYQVLNYNCVIYSIVISIAYLFGNAGNILFIMRMIGVILMVSSVFPIYLLSKEVLKSKWKALIVSLASLLIPEFTLSFYIIQEVLCYPVFLWICYLVYLKFTKEKNIWVDIGMIALLAFIFFIKSYAIVFAGAYFGTLCLIELKNKNFKKLGLYVAQGLTCLAIILIGISLIRLFNGEGVNHYSQQISEIFPITTEKIIAVLYGIFYYIIFFIFCMGFLPVLIPFFKFKSYEENDRKFIVFLMLSAIFVILEIAIIVFIPEETAKVYPYKFCFRYLAILSVPLVLMLLKCKKEDIKLDLKTILAFAILLIYIIWYYIGQGTKLASIDAPMLFAIQKTDGDLLPTKPFAVCVVAMFALIAIAMIVLTKLNKIKDVKKVYIMLTVIGLIVLMPINSFWHLHQANSNFAGEQLQQDYIKIADYIKRDYDIVYIIDCKDKTSIQRIYGYLFTDYSVIDYTNKRR